MKKQTKKLIVSGVIVSILAAIYIGYNKSTALKDLTNKSSDDEYINLLGNTMPTNSTSSIVSKGYVVFGSKPSCSSTGICNASIYQEAGSVSTTFSADTKNKKIILSFSFNELSIKQPNQVPFFYKKDTYKISKSYNLNIDIFRMLNIPSSAAIPQNAIASIKATGDTITMVVDYVVNDSLVQGGFPQLVHLFSNN